MELEQMARADTAAFRTNKRGEKSGRLLAAGGLLAALGASACCVLPFVLLTLGVGGAWMSNITWLAPYETLFIGAAVLFLALGFVRVYRQPKGCAEGSNCEPRSNRPAKIGLWLASALVMAAVAFPYISPML